MLLADIHTVIDFDRREAVGLQQFVSPVLSYVQNIL